MDHLGKRMEAPGHRTCLVIMSRIKKYSKTILKCYENIKYYAGKVRTSCC